MSEWHLPPDYIAENWTDEMLALMIEKFNARQKAISEAMSGKTGTVKPTENIMTDEQICGMLGSKMKVVKRGD